MNNNELVIRVVVGNPLPHKGDLYPISSPLSGERCNLAVSRITDVNMTRDGKAYLVIVEGVKLPVQKQSKERRRNHEIA